MYCPRNAEKGSHAAELHHWQALYRMHPIPQTEIRRRCRYHVPDEIAAWTDCTRWLEAP